VVGVARSSSLGFGGVRCMDVVHVDVGGLDTLGLDLATETSTVKSGTENGSFINIHVEHKFVFPNGGRDGPSNHRRFGGATGEDNGRDIFLQRNELANGSEWVYKHTTVKPALTKHA